METSGKILDAYLALESEIEKDKNALNARKRELARLRTLISNRVSNQGRLQLLLKNQTTLVEIFPEIETYFSQHSDSDMDYVFNRKKTKVLKIRIQRYALIYAIRNFFSGDVSLKAIGDAFRQDHTTIINALENVRNWTDTKTAPEGMTLHIKNATDAVTYAFNAQYSPSNE